MFFKEQSYTFFIISKWLYFRFSRSTPISGRSPRDLYHAELNIPVLPILKLEGRTSFLLKRYLSKMIGPRRKGFFPSSLTTLNTKESEIECFISGKKVISPLTEKILLKMLPLSFIAASSRCRFFSLIALHLYVCSSFVKKCYRISQTMPDVVCIIPMIPSAAFHSRFPILIVLALSRTITETNLKNFPSRFSSSKK